MNIFVGNLNHQITERQLQTMFEAFGEVTSVRLMTDSITRRPRGFGFVEMTDNTQAEKAIAQLHNTSVNQQAIVVNEAKPRGSNEFGSSTAKRWNNNRD